MHTFHLEGQTSKNQRGPITYISILVVHLIRKAAAWSFDDLCIAIQRLMTNVSQPWNDQFRGSQNDWGNFSLIGVHLGVAKVTKITRAECTRARSFVKQPNHTSSKFELEQRPTDDILRTTSTVAETRVCLLEFANGFSLSSTHLHSASILAYLWFGCMRPWSVAWTVGIFW